uniref:CCHC-type domain-containing protein n=1 Tax=Haemonchus placei TaxID=6290 RepID=A0A0N4W0S0_HAEPC
MKSTAWTSKQKAFFLIGHLDGIAREKIEELSSEEHEDYSWPTSSSPSKVLSTDTWLANLWRPVDNRSANQQRYSPTACCSWLEQLWLVMTRLARRNASSRSSRLRPDIRYYVKLDNPATFEKAVAKAQMVEQLLAEATADRLIRPSQPAQPIEGIRSAGPQQSGILASTCFNCGGSGNYSRVCPTPRANRRQPGDIWISDSREFALSWTDSSVRVKDCGADLTVSDQALCDRTNLLAFALHTSLAIDPTLTVRNLLDRDDIAATFLGNDLLQIHHCMSSTIRQEAATPLTSSLLFLRYSPRRVLVIATISDWLTWKLTPPMRGRLAHRSLKSTCCTYPIEIDSS